MSLPIIIQGGMGVGVSNWRLARSVSLLGHLGVVSGTLLPIVLARRLQQGDRDGHMRRALAEFPLADVAARILETYFEPDGLPDGKAFKPVAMPALPAGSALTELTVAANFVEVFLAKENHHGPVGINLLEKIQIPTLPSLYGAMLAGVDYVLMGAGIPRSIPGALDRLALGEPAHLKIDVTGSTDETLARFCPATFFKSPTPPVLRRPRFIAIVGSSTLASTLARKSTGRVDGFVVETETAGGHNAPPRGALQLTSAGEPVYGERDRPDFAKIRALGLPFWIAGSQAEQGRLDEARSLGAAGVQIGTAFAFCDESGIAPALKRDVLALARAGNARVFTDPSASPTGFPFKILQHPASLSSPARYAERPRMCDLGYLREAYVRSDGSTGYRCAAEPVEDFVRKGGSEADTAGRKCLCNGLLATIGLGQRNSTQSEPPLITAGHDINFITNYLPAEEPVYTAADVIRHTLACQNK